ncbi:heavy-metal-associated domain-containing protein [Roseomonas terrae]|jgi:copper chaperone|uniref:Heavy-metal-associated domain-containing protein n=1 Tax=Neoroseomonas terrae TaxID=424799 RepID=A0ABS5EQN7_9PROT|nr:cation transporter [Neoroseomonas terrae]MBR0652932.1 heavy-metal-associated domain-containing protein [Neoroseomonas terrae]
MTTTARRTVTLTVEGMSCGHCVTAVTAAIHARDPGATVTVDLGGGTVAAETTLPHDAVKAAVENEGYAVIA